LIVITTPPSQVDLRWSLAAPSFYLPLSTAPAQLRPFEKDNFQLTRLLQRIQNHCPQPEPYPTGRINTLRPASRRRIASSFFSRPRSPSIPNIQHHPDRPFNLRIPLHFNSTRRSTDNPFRGTITKKRAIRTGEMETSYDTPSGVQSLGS